MATPSIARKNQIANGIAAKMPGKAATLKVVGAGPAALEEIGGREARRHHAHEDAELEDRDQRDRELEARGDRHAGDVERHEHEVGAERDPLRLERRELHVDVGADRQGDRRRREHELDQGGEAGDVAAGRPEGAPAVLERAAGVRDRGRELGEAEDEGRVHQGDERRGHEKAERAGLVPAVAPAEVLARDHQADGDAPQREGAQGLGQRAGFGRLHAVRPRRRQRGAPADHAVIGLRGEG